MNLSFNGKTPPPPGSSERKPRILLSPLDWGLGHAARCIPLIHELLAMNCEIWIAAEGHTKVLLETEFPGLHFLQLEGYRAKYARTKTGLLWQMLIQSPRFIQVIKKEHVWLRQVQKIHGFDAVISDNRYGLWHPDIPCIFITHQLTIKSPLGKWSERLLQKRNYKYIQRFSECWIPDYPTNGLAGALSHPAQLPPIPTFYIGALSRLTKKPVKEVSKHLLVILSGPEPQRTIFENLIIAQISNYIGTATIVRGLPGDHSLIPSTNMIRIFNHLPAPELNEEMQKAEYIISRSGYSTVMDLAVLQKKSILIPTPGQTEQEYIANHLSEKKIAFCVTQKEFSLEKNLQVAARFKYKLGVRDSNAGIKNVIVPLISSLYE